MRLKAWHGAAVAVGLGIGGVVTYATTNPGSPKIVADVPGLADPRVTQANVKTTICVSGYTATVRPSTSYTGPLKAKLMASHHYKDASSNYELDHEISLEIGGAPSDPRNLWLEPQPRARAVDQIENQLHTQVCAGKITLKAAQQQLVTLKHRDG